MLSHSAGRVCTGGTNSSLSSLFTEFSPAGNITFGWKYTAAAQPPAALFVLYAGGWQRVEIKGQALSNTHRHVRWAYGHTHTHIIYNMLVTQRVSAVWCTNGLWDYMFMNTGSNILIKHPQEVISMHMKKIFFPLTQWLIYSKPVKLPHNVQQYIKASIKHRRLVLQVNW